VTTPSPGQLYLDGHTNRYLLDGPWEFRLGSSGPWTPVTVPNAWNATDESPDSMRGAVGWYRKDFRLPSAAKHTRWIMRFESVNYRATVYLNGHVIAKHEGGYIPFEVDLAKASRKGVDHLMVRVDSRRDLTTLPPLKNLSNGLPSGGWWNYGGILREVYLRRVNRVDMTELLARPALPCRTCPATVLLRATLSNLTSHKQVVRMTAAVGSQPARFPKITLAPHETRDLATKVGIAHPRLWEPGAPQLYQVTAAALIGHREAAGWSTQIGIRSIRVSRQGRLLINGLPATLRGIDLATWYSQAWFDRYLKGPRHPAVRRAATRRLLSDRWRHDPAGRSVDLQGDGNLFSFYYRSQLAIHARRHGHKRLVTCGDMRKGCPTLVPKRRDGYPGEYSYLRARQGG